jgi:hypothetical protein
MISAAGVDNQLSTTPGNTGFTAKHNIYLVDLPCLAEEHGAE